jgi:hypothetical protein
MLRDPKPGLLQRRRDEPTEMHPADFPPFDQTRTLEHREMFGNRRRGNPKRRTELGNGARTLLQSAQDSSPDRVGKRTENRVERASLVRSAVE